MRKKILRQIGVVLFPTLIFIVMKLLWFTYRKKYHFIDQPIEEQCLAVTWHSELLIAPQAYRSLRKKQKTSAIIAQHHDGEIIARTLKFLHITPLRGSSRRGARTVLIAAINALKDGFSVMITPDGPKGPRYTMNDGAVSLALRSNLPIMIVNYQANSYWQLKSWDKFIIPKPFTKIALYHQIIHLDRSSKEEAKEILLKQMLTYAM
ncbi:MAG: Protein of unknown function DUF374 [uncultured Sulfurovum sp.]|uniref:DUF374 domain-containing protein n=1 Tax=uncultured Sulfurovum sp. TaxID=269237 RepID=A0A6S6SJQ4_9BACT|nr:MAG: Protein of unknown function DUF374 [uncultured Sulfurovum sp.]